MSIQNGADYIPLEDDVSATSSRRPNGQQRGVKRKASAVDEDEQPMLRSHDRATPWMQAVHLGRYDTAIDILNAEVDAFRKYILPKDEEHSVRLMVVECIRRCIVRKWPSVQVLAFGSQETQTYFPDGDIDLVVHSSSVSIDRRDQVVKFLTEISRLLQKARVCRRVQIIGKARVPIIKFVTDLGHFAVDISVNQTNGINAIAVVNRFLQYMPGVRPLVMVIKAFLLQRGLNEPFNGGFGSYTVICMVVNFLQMHPKVRRREIDPNRNLGVLLLDFLELYGRLFNYADVGISVREGGSYFSRRRRGWAGVGVRAGTRLQISVEDPVDPNNDVAKSSAAPAVRSAFSAALESLSSSVIVRAQEMEARQTDNFVSLGGGDSRQISLLGSVVSLDQGMLNFRRDIQTLFRSGALQSFLELPPAGLMPATRRQEELGSLPHLSDVEPEPLPVSGDRADDRVSEENELMVTVDADHSPESRYSLGHHPSRNDGTTVLYEEDRSISDVSLSPALQASVSAEGEGNELSKDRQSAKRAFWIAKGVGNPDELEDIEGEVEQWEEEAA